MRSSRPDAGSASTRSVRARSAAEIPVVDARRGVDGHRVRRAPRVLAVRHHQRQVERVGPRRRHRRAQVARRVPDGPRDPLGRRRLRGEDDVGLVLAVRRVGDEHRTPRAQRLQRVLDRAEAHAGGGRHRSTPAVESSRSVYLASTSTSRLTRAPGASVPRVVASSVVGMSETPNDSSVTCGDRQRDAGDRDRALLGDVPRQLGRRARSRRRPSAARATGSGSCRRRRRGPGRRARRTGRPPRSARSRLTGLDTPSVLQRAAPQRLRHDVREERAVAGELGDRQTDAGDADRVAQARVGHDERSARPRRRASAVGAVGARSASTVPISSTIPVNIRSPPWCWRCWCVGAGDGRRRSGRRDRAAMTDRGGRGGRRRRWW